MRLTEDQRALLLREARLLRQALHRGEAPDERSTRCQRERAEEIERILSSDHFVSRAGSAH